MPEATHRETSGISVDADHLGVELDVNPELARAPHEQTDEIWIEALEGPCAPVQDGDLRPGARGDVSELERDVPAADEHDAGRHPVDVQEVFACRQPIGPGELQWRRHGAGGDQHAPADQAIVADGERGRVNEARPPVKLLDADLCPRLLGTLGRRVDERPLEAHERGPVDRQRAGHFRDPPPHHPGLRETLFRSQENIADHSKRNTVQLVLSRTEKPGARPHLGFQSRRKQ